MILSNLDGFCKPNLVQPRVIIIPCASICGQPADMVCDSLLIRKPQTRDAHRKGLRFADDYWLGWEEGRGETDTIDTQVAWKARRTLVTPPVLPTRLPPTLYDWPGETNEGGCRRKSPFRSQE